MYIIPPPPKTHVRSILISDSQLCSITQFTSIDDADVHPFSSRKIKNIQRMMKRESDFKPTASFVGLCVGRIDIITSCAIAHQINHTQDNALARSIVKDIVDFIYFLYNKKHLRNCMFTVFGCSLPKEHSHYELSTIINMTLDEVFIKAVFHQIPLGSVHFINLQRLFCEIPLLSATRFPINESSIYLER